MQKRYLLMTWGYPMKQCELKLKTNTGVDRSRLGTVQHNPSLARLWFQHIRARLEADAVPCERWQPPVQQQTLPWR